MRRIVRYVSLVVLLLVSCSPNSLDNNLVVGDVSIAYLRSLAKDRSLMIGGDVWIEGRVVLNDKLDECYKSFVVDDATAGIEVKVDVASVDLRVPLYSRVRVRCSGLYIGREGERVVLGTRPNDVYVVGRIPEGELYNHISVDISPEMMPPMPISVSVRDVREGVMQRYVRVEGLTLIAEEAGMAWGDVHGEAQAFDYALRHFVAGRDTLVVATQNRCHYASEIIPVNIVTLFGVVDIHEGSHVLRLSNHQIF